MSCLFLISCTYNFLTRRLKIDANERRVRRSLGALSDDTSPGCLLFSGDCSHTPVGDAHANK